MQYKDLRPAQALLDPQNPRLPDGTSNEKEAINRLLIEGYSQLLALARDLLEQGESNPTELPIVMPNGNKYIVLEGNRRFAALKLLNDPRLADDQAHRTGFERLKSKGKQPPRTLHCAVFQTREAADHWITLRHTGANGGVGVRDWNSAENARHRRRMKAPVDGGTLRAIAIADDLTEAYQADEELVNLIRKVRNEKLTNIGRLFSGSTLSRMQFEMRRYPDEGSLSLWAKHSADQLHAYFLQMFGILDEFSVDVFKNDSLRSDLLNDYHDLLPGVAESLDEYRRLADYPFSPQRANAGGAKGRGDASDPQTTGSASGEDDGSAFQKASRGGDGGVASNLASHSDDENPKANVEGDGDADDSESNESSGNGTRRQRDKRDEKALYSTVSLTNLSLNVQRLLKEARVIKIDENYATTCVLARVILELAVSDPRVLKWSGKKESDRLESKIRGCILTLDPDIDDIRKRTRPDLMQAFIEVEGMGVTYLHQFMHNPHSRPDRHLARRFSHAYSPLLNAINEAVK